MAVIPDYVLANGIAMPALGLGTWNMREPKEVVPQALRVGYRHIDTAKIYGTEEGIGQAIKDSIIPREELFITTKLWNADQGYESAHRAIDQSLAELDMDYVDLYLIHWPTTDELEGENRRQETWRAMEEIYASGAARAIGVSNFTVAHLEEMDAYAKTKPMVNQIQRHPFHQQREVKEYCDARGIQITNYSPLTRGTHLQNETVQSVAKEHNKSAAQIMLRWAIEHGDVVIPKATSEEHLRENAAIFDFTLTAESMATLDALDDGRSVL